ncbi:MAG: hypothetical protein HY996_09835 [Micrococcales bacterium]|nr:hypothetical protein [Micrococcales bacterium]
MTIPSPTDAGPLLTDEDVLDRVVLLVDRAFRRQLWLLLLDGDGVQLPVLPRIDLPARPDPRLLRVLPDRLDVLVQETESAELVLVYERPGRTKLTWADREWLGALVAGCAGRSIRLRGPVFAHTHGVRWVGPEDLAGPAAGRGHPP